MFCYNCGQEMQDGWKVCPVCGSSVANRDKTDELASPIPQQNLNNNVPNQNKTISQIAAQKDYKKKDSEGAALPITGIAIGVLFILASIAIKQFLIFLVGATFIGLGTYDLIKRGKRLSELKAISNGVKITLLCPKCKSPNIQMHMVEAGAVTVQGRTTISDNINPLRPFTHTNINHAPVATNIQYKNKCHCLNCGFVFDKPEKYIEK